MPSGGINEGREERLDTKSTGLEHVLLAALEQTRAATCVTNAVLDLPGPEIVYVNPAYCEMVGWDAQDVLGKTPRIMQGPLSDRRELDRLRSALKSGTRFSGETVNYRKDGTPFVISWSVDPVRDGAGVITHFIATQQDVTRLRRAELLLGAELEIDRTTNDLIAAGASAGHDVAELIDATARAVCSAVETMVGAGDVFMVVLDGDGSDHRVVPGGGAVGPSQLFASLANDQPSDADAAVHRGENEGTAWVGAPVVDADGRRIAWIAVTGLDSNEAAFVDEVAIATVGRFAGSALRTVGEYEWQRRTAVALQRAMMPTPSSPAVLEIATRYSPGADRTLVGGDWFDCIDSPSGPVVVVGDVVGSGITAAATMGRLQVLVRAMLEESEGLAEAVEVVDRICAAQGIFATVLLAAVDPRASTLTLASAGHPPPILVTSDSADLVSLRPAPPLGTGSSRTAQLATLPLSSDAIVVMYTDGIFERRGEDPGAGLARLVSEVERAQRDPEGLCDAITGAGLTSGGDDAVVVAFEMSGR